MSASLAALARNGWVNFAISQGAWFACVLGAAGGRPWLGPLVVLAWAALHVALCPDPRREAQLLLAVGVLGGFTTFSAFSLDTMLLWDRGLAMQAALYVAGSVLLSIAGVAAGLAAMRVAA